MVAGGVDGELAEEFAGGGVDDADVLVLDQQLQCECFVHVILGQIGALTVTAA